MPNSKSQDGSYDCRIYPLLDACNANAHTKQVELHLSVEVATLIILIHPMQTVQSPMQWNRKIIYE